MIQPPETISRVVTTRGARAAERRLLEELDRFIPSTPEDFALPVRVVVPSRSLRLHLIRRLARERGAVAGVVVQTLYGFAMEILAFAGDPAPRGDAAFELLTRRLARVHHPLQQALGDLQDGFDAAAGVVRDLLDAGFQPGNEEGVLERLDEAGGGLGRERIARARSLVRLAAEVFSKTDELGAWRSGRALQLAEDRILAGGEDLPPTRSLIIHGFADVTGVAADLLQALVRTWSGVVILDRPRDPVDPKEEDAGATYLSRLDERLVHLDHQADGEAAAPPELILAAAPDAEAEARWVAERIRELLASGEEPEEIGVVARGLEGIAQPLRRHFGRLGIPFSGVGATVPGAGARRRVRRLAELLRKGEATEVDLWAEAWGEGADHTQLLLGLRVLGVLRVADVARLRTDGELARGVRLPLDLGEDEETGDAPGRSTLPAKALEGAAVRARRLVEALGGWPGRGPADAHRRRTLAVLDALGWTCETGEWEAVARCLGSLVSELPDALEVEKGEWLKLVGDRLDRVGEVLLGGAGGGVQVMTVMESRARTFAHLFVVGLNRGVFPRRGHEDPLLPEAIRVRLASDVLPEMPVKARSADEERYLFAQLVSAAPRVRLSWCLASLEARLTPSSFVERLALCDEGAKPVPIAPLWRQDDDSMRPRPAYEHALLAAGKASPADLLPVLEAAIAEGRKGPPPRASVVNPGELAAARIDVLEAVEPAIGVVSPGPWSGFIGAAVEVEGARRWVTQFEATGVCPWRAFTQQRLGVFPLPDPHLGLPDADGRLVGLVVHEVLERIVLGVVDERAGDLEAALVGEPVEIRWPENDRFEDLLQRAAGRIIRREGMTPLGLTPLLVARARPLLEVALAVEWGPEGRLNAVLATEIEGKIEVEDLDRPLFFRADRVDSGPTGPELVDYKTGKPLSTAKKPETRRAHLLRKVAQGRTLQAVAYALGPKGGSGCGRYLYLIPDVDGNDEARHVSVRGDDEEVVAKFAEAVRTIGSGRQVGVVFPRLEEADGRASQHCSYCRVSEACRRDDSRFRSRLVAWMQGEEIDDAPAAEIARNLWWLGVEREGGDG